MGIFRETSEPSPCFFVFRNKGGIKIKKIKVMDDAIIYWDVLDCDDENDENEDWDIQFEG